ncbi:hypothetical protein C1H46_043490 [Malus baccata]|uniref:Uncharacterized protein n=1 Tax=Malus baccata TaxID=106549 RepID=A0A540K9Q9_MALBA|nr:hypothetical protein C1H46_043490 [Malus baccata]
MKSCRFAKYAEMEEKSWSRFAKYAEMEEKSWSALILTALNKITIGVGASPTTNSPKE